MSSTLSVLADTHQLFALKAKLFNIRIFKFAAKFTASFRARFKATSAVECLVASVACLVVAAPLAQAADWPLADAKWTISLRKDVNTTPPPMEPSDIRWFHFHRNHPTLPNSLTNTIAPQFVDGYAIQPPENTGLQLRYTVHGIPVSGWLSAPYRFELTIDNPGFSQLKDGIHDLSVEARGNRRLQYKPWRAFVHITRDKNNGQPFGFSKLVPIINTPTEPAQADAGFGPGVVYVHPNERNHVGYPVNPAVTAWQEPPTQANLYQELMAPHTELFEGVQMWWDHPAHANAPFVRGFMAKQGEDHRDLRVGQGHERLPMTDGPRSIGWMSPYITGQVDSQGRLAFAETGGRVAYLMPDGEIITIAGWRVKPDKDPIWWEKPTAQVRRNMENRGQWLNGRGEFRTPLDVAIDPRNERIWYVVGYEDHVIWQVTLPDDVRNQEATVRVFAGDPSHRPGLVDGNGTNARFNGPASIVFDPVNDVLYVADQDNDAIRQIDRSGQVSTLFGGTDTKARLVAQGVTWTDQLASRAASQFEVTNAQAQRGVKPTIYIPQTIRTDSQGNIILLEVGFGAIRKLDPLTGVTTTLGEVRQKHREFDRGWAWLDVDRYGNSGPVDGIYWCKFVSTLEGEIFNEVISWLPPEGGRSVPLFPNGTGLYPDGWGRLHKTNAPHYPWLVAVDPRGAVLLAGGGEHGVTRLRRRAPSDPIEGSDYWLGRRVWLTGAPIDASFSANSFALKYGWGGNNHLGFTNSWGLSGSSDTQLLDAFDAPAEIRNDPTAREHWLTYVKPNTKARDYPNQPPVDTPPTSLRPVTGSVMVNHRWRDVQFGRNITNPVVVTTALGNNGQDPAVVRVRNVTNTGFSMRVQEWDYQDGAHRSELVGYMAVPAGDYTLSNGARVTAGRISASGGVVRTQSFGQTFSQTPVVMATVASANEADAVTLRVTDVTASRFGHLLQEQEASNQVHARESVHYIAWEPSTGIIDGHTYEVRRTNDRFSSLASRINYSVPFSTTPLVFGNMQTTDGLDTASVRLYRTQRDHALLWIDEEQSRDAETAHTTERLGVIAITP